MNTIPSPLLLLGLGGAGCSMVRSVLQTYGQGIRALAMDTDAHSNDKGDLPFVLLGGNRLAGRGTGGQPAAARAAVQDNPALLDANLEGVRTVVVVTALGGGTGGGATAELLKHLHTLGIVTLVFATTPFRFEGQARTSAAQATIGSIAQQADVSIFLPLDDLTAGSPSGTMKDALEHGIETLSHGVTLLWRLLDKPGYIRLDAEWLRSILSSCGRGRFASATASGPDRADVILKTLAEHPLLKRTETAPPVRSAIVGILAGDDLRLSEIASISSGITALCGSGATLDLGTVNDEAAFSGTISVVVVFFEESAAPSRPSASSPRGNAGGSRRPSNEQVALGGGGRFRHSEKTMWNDEDLDIPTYIRRSLTLDR